MQLFKPARSSAKAVSSILGRRSFHLSTSLFKNPYYFYDLAAKQPRHNISHVFDPIHTNFGHEHLDATQRARLVFGVRGSRDASREEANQQVRTVAGVKIPGRPEEPTNCCMSGCVNCVWEMYKDDLTDYKQKKREAYKALMQHPELKWPEDLFGPEPLSRLSESEAKARKESKSTDTTDPTKSTDSSLSSTDTSELDVGFSRIEDDDDLDVSIKQFLMLENRIREKKRENKLNQTAASQLSTSNSDPQAHV